MRTRSRGGGRHCRCRCRCRSLRCRCHPTGRASSVRSSVSHTAIQKIHGVDEPRSRRIVRFGLASGAWVERQNELRNNALGRLSHMAWRSPPRKHTVCVCMDGHNRLIHPAMVAWCRDPDAFTMHPSASCVCTKHSRAALKTRAAALTHSQ